MITKKNIEIIHFNQRYAFLCRQSSIDDFADKFGINICLLVSFFRGLYTTSGDAAVYYNQDFVKIQCLDNNNFFIADLGLDNNIANIDQQVNMECNYNQAENSICFYSKYAFLLFVKAFAGAHKVSPSKMQLAKTAHAKKYYQKWNTNLKIIQYNAIAKLQELDNQTAQMCLVIYNSLRHINLSKPLCGLIAEYTGPAPRCKL